MLGFVSSVMGVHSGLFLLIQYVVVFGAIVGGLFVIHRGIVIEAPQFVTNAISLITERLTRRFATP